jgi:hypothetical protein
METVMTQRRDKQTVRDLKKKRRRQMESVSDSAARARRVDSVLYRH